MSNKTESSMAISIHTTTQVVTGLPGLIIRILSDFNPHHHAGGDLT